MSGVLPLTLHCHQYKTTFSRSALHTVPNKLSRFCGRKAKCTHTHTHTHTLQQLQYEPLTGCPHWVSDSVLPIEVWEGGGSHDYVREERVTRLCPQGTTLQEKGEPKQTEIRTRVCMGADQPSTLPLVQCFLARMKQWVTISGSREDQWVTRGFGLSRT